MNKKRSYKKQIIYAVLGVGALTAVAVPIFAGGGHCSERGGHGLGGHDIHIMSDRMIGKLSRKLDLDDAQRKALYAAADDARPTLREMREQLRASRRALGDLDPKSTGYDAQVMSLAKKHGALASDMTLMVAGMKRAMADVLNAEQMEKLMNMLRHRDQHRHRDHPPS